jgi:Transposase DDE domain
MRTKTPFLPGFPTLLFGRAKRSAQAILRSRQREIRSKLCGEIALEFADEVPSELIEADSRTQRERVYSNRVTFWAFLSQVFSEDGSCAAAVAGVQQMRRSAGLTVPSANTASYTEARQELPDELIQSVHTHVTRQLDAHVSQSGLWRGYRVRSVDGTSVLAPDTEANQAEFPQPCTQQPGCGFPAVHLVGLIDLGHGGLEDFSQSDCNTSELRGYEMIESHLREGDLLVADRLYSNYELIARLAGKNIPFIGRNHQSRKVDFRKGRKAGRHERIIQWSKPHFQPPGSDATREQWDGLPDKLEMRIIRTKGPDRDGKMKTRYVVTTLTDAVAYPAEEIASLYHHRWEIELRFRDIKTTMGMEMLRTQSPKMLRKEIMMHVIAYNLIKLLMLKAAAEHGGSHRRISFKGVLQVIDKLRTDFKNLADHPRKLAAEKANLLLRIAERIAPFRSGRNEPRKKKRRPKSYGWLQRPRHEYFEHFRSDLAPLQILEQAA